MCYWYVPRNLDLLGLLVDLHVLVLYCRNSYSYVFIPVVVEVFYTDVHREPDPVCARTSPEGLDRKAVWTDACDCGSLAFVILLQNPAKKKWRKEGRQDKRLEGDYAQLIMAQGYHEVAYDDGDQYKGEWNADGKVCLLAMAGFRPTPLVFCSRPCPRLF